MPQARTARILFAIFLACLVLAGLYILFFTQHGQLILQNPKHFRKAIQSDVQSWVQSHRVIAPSLFVLTYLLCGLSGLPVWWLQVLGGIAFGLLPAIALCSLSASATAVCGLCASRWILAEWFHTRVEAKLEKLRRVEKFLGHNGFLVVIAIRLLHTIPFGISNYILGLTEITIADVALGTFLGSAPAMTTYVTLGINPHQIHTWRFFIAIIAMHVVLLIPLLLRYLHPRWFKKFGVQ